MALNGQLLCTRFSVPGFYAKVLRDGHIGLSAAGDPLQYCHPPKLERAPSASKLFLLDEQAREEKSLAIGCVL